MDSFDRNHTRRNHIESFAQNRQTIVAEYISRHLHVVRSSARVSFQTVVRRNKNAHRIAHRHNLQSINFRLFYLTIRLISLISIELNQKTNRV
jgi:hypothetical protein